MTNPKKASTMIQKPDSVLYIVIGLICVFFLNSCGSKTKERNVILFDHLSKESEKGYFDVYCTRCMTGWAIYRIENGQEMLLGQLQLGKNIGNGSSAHKIEANSDCSCSRTS